VQTLEPEKANLDERGANSVNPADLSVGAGARGNNIRNIGLIIGREYNARVRRKMFVVASGIMMVIVLIGTFLPTVIQLLSSNSPTKIAVIENTGPIAGQTVVNYLDQSLNTTLNSGNPSALPNQAQPVAAYKISQAGPNQTDDLRKEVQDGKLDALLTLGRNPKGDLSFDYYTKSNDVSGGARVRQALTVLAINDRLSRAGLAQETVGQLFSPPEIKTGSASQEKPSNQGKSSEEQAVSYGVAFLLVVLLFTTIQGYGVAVAQGAAEEKSNRVMEIMVSAATPFQLMMGKIIGIGLAGFTQVGLIVITGIVGLLIQSPIQKALLGDRAGGTPIDISKVSIASLGFFLVFYVLGFILWASLYAAVGSLVSRQEDVQGALTPFALLNTGAYLAAIFGLQSIDATWVTVLSYVPFFTPILMFARLSLGAAPLWEGILSVALLIVWGVIFTWLSARVYRAGVLLYGRKPTMAQIFKLMWAKG